MSNRRKVGIRITSYNVCYTKLLRVFSLLSKKKVAEDKAREAAVKAEEILQGARKEAENTLKEAALQAKDYQLQVKLDFERETRERKNEISQRNNFV